MKKIKEEVLKQFNNLAKKAYVPYSNFHVLAYFEKKDGSSFSGINIENAAYPNTMCAERVGIHSAINNGIKLEDIKVIHIFSPDSKDFLSPCGGCRQSLSEHIDHNVEIRMYNKNGEYISKKFQEIFPHSVEQKNIKGIN